MELILFLVTVLGIVLTWSFKNLYKPHFHTIACTPSGTSWTFYGAILATASVVSSLLGVVLLSAIGVSLTKAIACIALTTAISLPASALMAKWIENGKSGFTIGGAAFVGTLLAPPLIYLGFGPSLLIPILAVLSICFALGEGLGRLACISFGCCYGAESRRSHLGRWLASKGLFYTYDLEVHKASWESGYSGKKLVPIQAITSVVNCVAALTGLFLFLSGAFAPALVCCFTIHQVWRFFSEFWRADYRGGGAITTYQKMSWANILYIGVLSAIIPSAATVGALGLTISPWLIIFFQLQWLCAFLYTGRSKETYSEVNLRKRKDARKRD